MKKIIFLMVFVLLAANFLSSQTIDVGKDKIVKVNNTIITKKELEQKYNQILKLQKQGVTNTNFTKKQVLDLMIKNVLIKDELKKASYIVLDRNQFNETMKQYKTAFKQEMVKKDPNFQYTDEKFKRYVETEGKLTYEKFEEQIQDEIKFRQYIMKKAEPQLAKVRNKSYTVKADFPVELINSYGQKEKYYSMDDFYNKNLNQFVVHKSVEIKHIFAATVSQDGTMLPDSEKKIKKKKITDVLKRLKAGEDFDTLCELNTEDISSRDYVDPKTKKVIRGYLGTLYLNDEVTKQQFGNNVFDILFSLKKGTYSDVVESRVGYHIFYVMNKQDQKLLSLDESKEKIVQYFKYMEHNTILNDILVKTENDLKKKATIVYFKKEYE